MDSIGEIAFDYHFGCLQGNHDASHHIELAQSISVSRIVLPFWLAGSLHFCIDLPGFFASISGVCSPPSASYDGRSRSFTSSLTFVNCIIPFFMSQDVIEARLKDPKLAEKDDLLSLFINEASSDGEHMVATIFLFFLE